MRRDGGVPRMSCICQKSAAMPICTISGMVERGRGIAGRAILTERWWDGLRDTRKPAGTCFHLLVLGAPADRIMSRLHRWQTLNANP